MSKQHILFFKSTGTNRAEGRLVAYCTSSVPLPNDVEEVFKLSLDPDMDHGRRGYLTIPDDVFKQWFGWPCDGSHVEYCIRELETVMPQVVDTDIYQDLIKYLNESKSLTDRDQFMDFFRNNDRWNTLSPDDKVEVFMGALHGSSDITADLLDDLLSTYNVSGIEVIELGQGQCNQCETIVDCTRPADQGVFGCNLCGTTVENVEPLDHHRDNLEDSISVSWHVDDVLSVRSDLTKEQAREVLQDLKHAHDANIGINWDTIISQAAILFPEDNSNA